MIILAIAIAISGVAFASGAAHAGTGNQWCDDQGYCLNAWGGGPFIKSDGYPAANNDFSVIPDASLCNGGFTTATCPSGFGRAGYPIVQFEYTNGGSWAGRCIGDAYNLSGRADTSLDTCGGGSNGTGGWGVNFIQGTGNGCIPGKAVFLNIHWLPGYISVADNNGTPVYLNNSTGDYFSALPPS